MQLFEAESKLEGHFLVDFHGSGLTVLWAPVVWRVFGSCVTDSKPDVCDLLLSKSGQRHKYALHCILSQDCIVFCSTFAK